jgi:hypothetical protein
MTFMDVWIGGLAIDDRSPEQVIDALTSTYAGNSCPRCEGDDVNIVGDERALLVAGTKGWTSLYLEAFENDAAMAIDLSKQLTTTIVCHRSVLYDAFSILVYHDGELIDEYQSCPDYFKSYEEADSSAEELARTTGDVAIFQAAVSRIDAQLLADIYQKSRIDKLSEQIEPEMTVSKALNLLRKALKIGTFEHGFDDLWYGAEDFQLKANFLAFNCPDKEPKTRWGHLKKQARDSRDRWKKSKNELKEKMQELKSSLPRLYKKKPADSKSKERPEKETSDSDEN